MNDLSGEDLAEIGRDVSELIEEIGGMAEAIFKGAVERAGLVLTEDF